MITHPLRSLRWRLPLSYAGIALLTALTLGATLLLILRTYYQQRERVFLENRAAMIGAILQPLLEDEQEPTLLEKQMEGLAFLAQVRVQLLDQQAQLVVDSGPPPLRAAFTLPLTEPLTPTRDLLLLRNEFTRTVDPLGVSADITSRIIISINTGITEQAVLGDQDYRFIFQAPAPDLFFREPFNADTDGVDVRSSQWVHQALQDAQGQLMGYVRLSDGPTYGRQIVTSAAWAVLIASLLATLVAAVVGWWISRQLSAPLLQLTAATAQMAAGHLAVRAAVTSRDELGVLAHSFNEMAHQVEETVKTLRHFVADAAHEINTPITALRTNLELAPATPLTHTTLAQVARLEGLVKNLLLLSRLEATSFPSQSNPAESAAVIDLAQLVQVISEPFASRAEQQEINFGLAIANEIESPPLVRGNESELSQALQNLLDNALKFSDPGGTIRLTVAAADTTIRIVVEDTGIGVAADELPLLFQRFYRARNAAAYPGNGLGLAIVKVIVERHGGTVTADHTGHGMRFQVTLPGQPSATRQ